MAREDNPLTVTDIPAPAPGDSVLMTWLAGDAVDGNVMDISNSVLLVRNTDAANPYTFTVEPVADRLGRTSPTNLTSVSLAAGEMRVVSQLRNEGWGQSGSVLWLDVENAAVEFALIALS